MEKIIQVDDNAEARINLQMAKDIAKLRGDVIQNGRVVRDENCKSGGNNMYVSPLYHNVRPDGDLLPQESAAFDLLERLGINYDRVSSDAADNMEKCEAVSAVLGMPVCKNLFLCNRQKTQFYLLCMPPRKPFHTKDLSKQINSARLSFAPEEMLWEALHCTPGSATILGLANDAENRVRLLMDKETYQAEYLSCHPCICTSTLKLRMSDVLEKLLPDCRHDVTVVELPDE